MDDVIAIALATGNASRFDAPDLTAPCFLSQILQEQRRHGALEAHMDLRHRTVRQGFNFDAKKGQPLIECGDVRLTTR